MIDSDTGELLVGRFAEPEPRHIRMVRIFTKSVEQVIGVGMPDNSFRLMATKDGRIVNAFGPIAVASLDMAFPGCLTADEVIAANEALNVAGATRGNSPAGRALDYALRKNSALAQWRMRREFMRVFAASLFGGVQFGGNDKPDHKPGRVALDIVSSYPYLATWKLPRVRDAIFERGYKRNAVLLQIVGTQTGPALFSRGSMGSTEYLGDVSGWYVAEEVDYHVAMGRLRVDKVIASCTFTHSEKYLARVVDHLFTHREKYSRGTPERSVIKSALNGLLGKFASPISPWRAPTDAERRELPVSRRLTTLRVGKSMLVKDPKLDNLYPRHSNIIWTALTYARARVRLWEKMDEIRAAGGRVLWVHTDAIIADVPAGFVSATGTALGEWREILP